MRGQLIGDKVIVDWADELYQNWFGERADGKLELRLIEAAFLCERGRLDVYRDRKRLNFKALFHYCSSISERFFARYVVYKDLRSRGLAVRTGFKGCDFRVYERGSQRGKKEKVKWIVFVSAEDYPCALEQLGRAIKLAQNIRALALWSVVDNDADVTYYIINSISP